MINRVNTSLTTNGYKAMLSREQIYIMLMLRDREKKLVSPLPGEKLFSTLPDELIHKIIDFGQDPNCDIAKALHYAAYARQEDVIALLKLLDENPSLPAFNIFRNVLFVKEDSQNARQNNNQ